MNFYQNDNVLEVIDVSKNYQSEKILQGINIELGKGEFVTLIGPSGIGKSTLFNIVSGLQIPESGKIVINGHEVTGKTGVVSYMHQKDLLLPWRTVIENGSLPLEIKGMGKEDAKIKVKEVLETFELAGDANKYPSQLSGGMRQRVALLRTYMTSKDIMLLDEPFGGLDALTKHKMQEYLLQVQRNIRASILFITHDIEEAIFLSDRIYILNGNPAKIIKEIKVNLPRPRTGEIISSVEFTDIKRDILKLLQGEKK
ncbi:MAG: ABC transporter ATP-binding protein [Clostridiales bacterium]|nr:ABC transporter ATP-binding protein [Clostridiales bacterium]